MIDGDPPIEFINVPQTGGEAIEKTYPEYRWGSARFPPFDISRRSPWHNLVLLQTLFKNKTCFGVIRDPYERLLEIYKKWQFPDNTTIFNQTLESWAQSLKTMPYFLDNNLRPQCELLSLCKHILLYDEYLENNLQKLMYSYDIPLRPLAQEDQKTRYYRVNKTSFSPANTAWIKEFYKSDFDMVDKVIFSDGLLTQ